MVAPLSSTTDLTTVSVEGMSYVISLPFADSDYIQRMIRTNRVPYELEMLSAMNDSLQSGDLVLDIGANIGNHTMFLAAVTKARVIAYEPDTRLTDSILRSVKANDFSALVTVRPAAVGDTTEELVLCDDNEGNLGAQHLVESKNAFGPRVPVIRLDDEMPQNRVAAIKIDVEGYEEKVLRGATALIQRDSPDLWIECLDNDQYTRISRLLFNYGYHVNGIFNPSPTYQFIHDPGNADEILVDLSGRMVERIYSDRAAFMRTRDALLDANAKYRTVSHQYVELRDRQNDLQESVATEMKSEISDLDAECRSLTSEKAELEKKSLRLEEELGGCRSEIAALTLARATLTTQLAEADDELSELRGRQQRYRDDFNLLRSYVSDSEERIEHLTAEADEIRLQLDEASAQKSRLDAELSQARDQLNWSVREVKALNSRLIEQRKLNGALVRARDRFRHDAARLDGDLQERSLAVEESLDRENVLAEKLRSLRASLDSTSAAKEAATAQLSALRSSQTYRAGQAWRDVTTWKGFWALIPRLVSIALEKK